MTTQNFIKAQETYAALEACSIDWEIKRIDSLLDDWDMTDESVETRHHYNYLSRRRDQLTLNYECLTGRTYPTHS